MTTEINYEEEVKKVYPDAYSDGCDINDYESEYFITTPELDELNKWIGSNDSKSRHDAWKSAYNQLKREGKF